MKVILVKPELSLNKWHNKVLGSEIVGYEFKE